MTAYPGGVQADPHVTQLVLGWPLHHDDREVVTDAIHADALAHDGIADPNRVRAALTDRNGDLVVNPRVLAATYSGLARSGRLTPAGWTESDLLTSRNRGRPQRRWRWLAPSPGGAS